MSFLTRLVKAGGHLNIRRRFSVVKNYIWSFKKTKPSDQVRAVIFAQGRSGSSVLESLICSTGYFALNGEILAVNRGEIRYPARYIRGGGRWAAPENFIFHVKIYQLTRDRKRPVDPGAFLKSLYSDGWKIIYLRRKDKVRQAMSNIVAENRGDYHKFDGSEEKFHLSVDCDDLVNKIKERLRFAEEDKKALSGMSCHEVVYESDLEDPDMHQLTIDRILDYLSLDRREVSTDYRKINTQSMEELVINYDEVADRLMKEGFQDFRFSI